MLDKVVTCNGSLNDYNPLNGGHAINSIVEDLLKTRAILLSDEWVFWMFFPKDKVCSSKMG